MNSSSWASDFTLPLHPPLRQSLALAPFQRPYTGTPVAQVPFRPVLAGIDLRPFSNLDILIEGDRAFMLP